MSASLQKWIWKMVTYPVTSFHELHTETVDVSFDTSDDGKEEVRYHPEISKLNDEAGSCYRSRGALWRRWKRAA